MKYTLKILFLIITSLNIYGQNEIGFTFGFNNSFISGIDTSYKNINFKEKEWKYGINFKLFLNIKLSYLRYIQIGLQYSEEGLQFKNISYYASYNEGLIKSTKIQKFNFNYLKIPIIWKESFDEWYTHLGFYGGFLLNPTTKWIEIKENFEKKEYFTGESQSIAKKVNYYDMGLILGAGIQLPLFRNYDFIAGANYSYSFLPINKTTSNTGILQKYSMYNQGFNVYLGIIITNKAYKYVQR